MGWSQLAISVLGCARLFSFLPAATTPTLVSARRRVVRPPAPLPHPFLRVLGIGGTSCVAFTFYVPPDCAFQACRWTIPVGSTFRWSTNLWSKGTFSMPGGPVSSYQGEHVPPIGLAHALPRRFGGPFSPINIKHVPPRALNTSSKGGFGGTLVPFLIHNVPPLPFFRNLV